MKAITPPRTYGGLALAFLRFLPEANSAPGDRHVEESDTTGTAAVQVYRIKQSDAGR